MTAIEVNERGELKVDGVPKAIEDLTQEFLEQLVDDSLDSKVTYNIDGVMPLAGFFKAIEDGTKEGSELRNAKEEREKQAESALASGEKFIAGCADVLVEGIVPKG